MNKPLVTILSPVYNGETYIKRFLDSLLQLDYENIDFILMNDGSTDNTETIITEYKDRLEQKFRKFIYKKGKNQGAAGAINDGLKLIDKNTKYLTWPDSDDILTSDSINKMVAFLEHNPKYGFIRAEALVFRENNLNYPIYSYKPKIKHKTNLFENFVTGEDIYYCCGCYMVNFETFKKANPKLEIYVTKWGQNYQMLLPISYISECGYLPEIVYHYIIRENSHSHNDANDFNKIINRYKGYEDIITNVLNTLNISNEEKNRLLSKIKTKNTRQMMNLAIQFKNDEIFLENYNNLDKTNCLTKREKKYKNKTPEQRCKLYKIYETMNKTLALPERIIRKTKRILKLDI